MDRLKLLDLDSDTAYSIVCLSADGTARSQVTRFRTALSDDDWRIVSFGAISCLGGNLPWPSLTQAKNDKYDFFCFLGDSVYAEADTKSGFWEYWDYVLRQDGLYDLFSSCSVVGTWDEMSNNTIIGTIIQTRREIWKMHCGHFEEGMLKDRGEMEAFGEILSMEGIRNLRSRLSWGAA